MYLKVSLLISLLFLINNGIIENGDSMAKEKNWYKYYQEEVAQMEKEYKCPVCGRDYISHYGSVDYIFVCNNCGASFELTGKYTRVFQDMD